MMNNKRLLKLGVIACFIFSIFFVPMTTHAMDLNETNETANTQAALQEQPIENDNLQNNSDEDTSENIENKNSNNDDDPSTQITDDNNTIEEHKISVVITKVDENGLPLKDAILQIINSEGIIVDEWISDGTEHNILLPEGEYILHEKTAPIGYELAEDKAFTVKAVINEINAGVDHDPGKDVCWHYKGVPLYYVESEGQKQEVYCINQGWDEPENTNYDGAVLTADNIKLFAPDSDDTMTNEELYHKVLDIIYHRSKANEDFPELSDKAIRFITEYALKNYTSTNVKEGDNVTYLYRNYRYDVNNPKHFVVDPGNGTALGQLAKHWWYYHGRKTIPSEYADLYFYLVREEDSHPSDMHLYIYSTKEATPSGENYQNLLGVRWFNPYDENYAVEIECVNVPAKQETSKITNPQTSDNVTIYIGMFIISTLCLVSSSIYSKNQKKLAM